MKRFHVHVATDDLEASIRFYSGIFAAEPTVIKPDYAKWMLDDPRINFAISTRGHKAGVNHLGFQVDSDEELEEVRERVKKADAPVLKQDKAACCYARSNKYWVLDPSSVAWEAFHSLDEVPVYGEDTINRESALTQAGCCVPEMPQAKTGICCGSSTPSRAQNGKTCCG